MIRCSCCERRTGHFPDPCDCAQDYCHRCLLCDAHCVCTPAPERVGFVKLVAMIAVSMVLFAGFGSAVAARNGHNEVLCVVLGAIVGAVFALAATGEMDKYIGPKHPTHGNSYPN